MEYFKGIKKIKCGTGEPLSFTYYRPEMAEKLPFAMAWWHNLGAGGVDMFGGATIDKSFGESDPVAYAKAKADAGFEFMEKLGIHYFCFHDIDLVPEADTLDETQARLDAVADHIVALQKKSGIKCLWGTANLFGNARYMNGAGSANDPAVFAYACAQVKRALDLTVKFGGKGYVFWGGREGYETLLNTDTKLEQENIAKLMKMAVKYGRSIGFDGTFYIEPKPREPMKHQYDFDAATAIGFLRQYGLDKDFKLNIEANHATLAGHTFQHELRMARDAGMMGSVDVNEGDASLGWDVDRYPTNIYETTMAMYEILKNGGLGNGGLNFDAKNRRPSNTYEDMFYGYIAGMDAFARGLLNAEKLMKDGRIDQFVADRYAGYQTGIGKQIRDESTSLEALSDYARTHENPSPASGRQEMLEKIINDIIFDW